MPLLQQLILTRSLMLLLPDKWNLLAPLKELSGRTQAWYKQAELAWMCVGGTWVHPQGHEVSGSLLLAQDPRMVRTGKMDLPSFLAQPESLALAGACGGGKPMCSSSLASELAYVIRDRESSWLTSWPFLVTLTVYHQEGTRYLLYCHMKLSHNPEVLQAAASSGLCDWFASTQAERGWGSPDRSSALQKRQLFPLKKRGKWGQVRRREKWPHCLASAS